MPAGVEVAELMPQILSVLPPAQATVFMSVTLEQKVPATVQPALQAKPLGSIMGQRTFVLPPLETAELTLELAEQP